MKKSELAYKLFDVGIISFEDYQCVDCGGSNVLVDSFYQVAIQIKANAARDGYLQCVADFEPRYPEISWVLDGLTHHGLAHLYANRMRQGGEV